MGVGARGLSSILSIKNKRIDKKSCRLFCVQQFTEKKQSFGTPLAEVPFGGVAKCPYFLALCALLFNFVRIY